MEFTLGCKKKKIEISTPKGFNITRKSITTLDNQCLKQTGQCLEQTGQWLVEKWNKVFGGNEKEKVTLNIKKNMSICYKIFTSCSIK